MGQLALTPEASNEMNTIIFDPEGSSKFPYTAAVEGLLGGVGRLIFGDGTVQFADNETYPDVVFSPRLPEDQLEMFCRTHLAKYESYFNENFDLMDAGSDLPPINRFWE